MTTTTENGTALAVRDRNPADLALRFVIPLDELRLQLAQLEEFKRDIMVEGIDYGTIPGTPKPTLLKPGAEKLTLVFGLAPSFTVTSRIEDWDRGFFHYETRCDLVSKRTGEIVASAHGSANSKETRYRWRDAKPTCPDCNFELRRSKKRDGDTDEAGWYCWGKLGGCGATWPKDTVKAVGRVENPEPYELVNTLLKMSEKRSLVAAALIATGGSGTWTMDLEDMPSDATVIDVAPAMADAPSGNGKPQSQPTAVMVSSADSRLWQRWLEVKGEAEGLGLRVSELRLPVELAELKQRADRLLTAIGARKQTLADQDARAAEGKAAHDTGSLGEVQVDVPAEPAQPEPEAESALTEALSKNANLLEAARSVGAKGLGSLTAKEGWPLVKIKEANVELGQRLRSRSNELDERAAAEQKAF